MTTSDLTLALQAFESRVDGLGESLLVLKQTAQLTKDLVEDFDLTVRDLAQQGVASLEAAHERLVGFEQRLDLLVPPSHGAEGTRCGGDPA